jgi:hypothetical protein
MAITVVFFVEQYRLNISMVPIFTLFNMLLLL